MVRAVIFDMDGVIVDSEPLADVQNTIFLKKLGHEIDRSFLHATYGLTARKFWEIVKKRLELPQDIEELVRVHREFTLSYWSSVEKLKPIAGIPELIERLKDEKIRLALASSANSKRIPIFLEKLGMRGVFDVVISGDDITHSKPDPEIYLKAAKKLDVSPRDCLAIEDATSGVASAGAAGMKVIAYRAPNSRQDLSAADLVIEDFAELDGEMLKAL